MIERISGLSLSGPSSYLSRRATTLFLLACMTVPLFYLAWDSFEVDFRAFYVAGVAASSHLDPYVDNRDHGLRYIDPVNQNSFSRWLYPPTALFFVIPLAKLSYTTARLAIVLVSLASLIWILMYLSGRFAVADAWVLVAYTSLPVMACVERGQIDLLVLFLLVLACRCGGRFWAGIPLGIAIAIKLFPAALLLWLVLERRYRQAATAFAVFVAIGLLSLWQFGLSAYAGFLRTLTRVGPTHLAPSQVDLVQELAGVRDVGHWLTLTHAFVGSYNNPLVLLSHAGVIVAVVLVVSAAFLLHFKRVSPETGYFTMVLVSQLMNNRLWTMGMVLYLPICIIAIGKARSRLLPLLLVVPLYLPAQVRFLSVSPRFVIALAVIAYAIMSGIDENSPYPDDADPKVLPRSRTAAAA